jgi:hypothetical protein
MDALSEADKRAFFGAFGILAAFGVIGYFLPTIMIAAGNASLVLAGMVAVGFVGGFFVLWWLRSGRRDALGLVRQIMIVLGFAGLFSFLVFGLGPLVSAYGGDSSLIGWVAVVVGVAAFIGGLVWAARIGDREYDRDKNGG